jgi:hypothetical protein
VFPPLGRRTMLVSARRLVHPDNNSASMLVTFDDVTERRRVDAEKDILLAETRHRMKNLLAVVRALATQTEVEGRTGQRGIRGQQRRLAPRADDVVTVGDVARAEARLEAVDALLACAGPAADVPLLAVDLRHLGAAMGTGAAHHGVLDRIDATYALFAVGLPVTPELGAAIPPALDRLRDALAGWSADTSYLNLADRPVDPARLFDPDRFARLRAVKAAYDPHQILVSNHPIPLPG